MAARMMDTPCSPCSSCSFTRCTARRELLFSIAREISNTTPLRDTATISSTSSAVTCRRSGPRYTSSLASSLEIWRVLSFTRWMNKSSAALSKVIPSGLAMRRVRAESSPSQPGLVISILENSFTSAAEPSFLKKERRLSISLAESTKKVSSGRLVRVSTSSSSAACTASLRAPCGVSPMKLAPFSQMTLRPPNMFMVCRPEITRPTISTASSTVAAEPSMVSLPQPSLPSSSRA